MILNLYFIAFLVGKMDHIFVNDTTRVYLSSIHKYIDLNFESVPGDCTQQRLPHADANLSSIV